MSARVAVVGGGITGLTAARTLRTAADPAAVTLVEATGRLGGKVHTQTLDGLTVDTGADAFLARTPEGVRLCRELGLARRLVAPATTEVSVRWDGRLHPLPQGLVLGAPTRLTPLLRSSLLSTAGAARAALDLVLPRVLDPDHETVADLIGYRFGTQVLERLVDPLMAGIYAGDPHRLGAADATPPLAEAARQSRSLLRGLRRRPQEPAPLFLTLEGGMGHLVDALAAAPEMEVRLADPVRLVEATDGGYRLRLASGDVLDVDGVILAVPAFAAASLLRELAPDAAAALRQIAYASAATVVLVYPAGSGRLRGSGLLVPRAERTLVKAASWVSSKWPERAPGDQMVVRASIGRHGDRDALERSDRELADVAHRELSEVIRLGSRPDAWLVTRWERSLPQYLVGHRDLVRRIRGGLAHLPGVTVAGAAYDGIGITACVRQGQEAAWQVSAVLHLTPTGPASRRPRAS
ncbi:MAG TPA: protoporphyrinogen oxidase [Nitriliruptorales bacterium]|nr:protoporphyrinogen oxidase [Nitriliruptorales bacterium]